MGEGCNGARVGTGTESTASQRQCQARPFLLAQPPSPPPPPRHALLVARAHAAAAAPAASGSQHPPPQNQQAQHGSASTHLHNQLVLSCLVAFEAVDARRAGAQVQPVDADLLQNLGLQLIQLGQYMDHWVKVERQEQQARRWPQHSGGGGGG